MREQEVDPSDATDDTDVTTALCHELQLPLGHLLASLERAHEVLQRRAPGAGEQSLMQLAHCLADAHTTAQHLLRVVADVGLYARPEPQRLRQLDLRVAMRAAAAMAQPYGGAGAIIAIDAPEPAWVEGVDTRLVHVFIALFAEAVTEEVSVRVRLRLIDSDVVVEVLHGVTGARAEPTPVAGGFLESRALSRAVVRHIVTAHGGHIEHWPATGAGISARVRLPAALRMSAA